MKKNRILHAALFTPLCTPTLAVSPHDQKWGLPLLLWGPPGSAKTSVVEEFGPSFGWHVETLSPGERGEGAFGVTPVPDGETLTYPAPDWVKKFGPSGGVVFVDETNTAPPALQPYLMGLIQARRIGSHCLPKNVRVLGAANPVEQSAGGWDLAPPVANRFGHLEWEDPTPNELNMYWMGFDGVVNVGDVAPVEVKDPIAEEKRVLKAWPGLYTTNVGLVSGFLHKLPERRREVIKVGARKDGVGCAWPSPRTWHYAIHALTSAHVHSLNENERDDFLCAFIGIGTAREFLEWKKAADLPDPLKVLEGTEKWKHKSTRLDITIAVMGACTGLVVPMLSSSDKKAKQTDLGPREKTCVDNLIRLFQEVSKTDPDIIIPFLVQLFLTHNHYLMKNAKGMLLDLNPVITEAKYSGTK